MARPQKSGLEYFPLDSNFFGDPKIEDLLFKHGPNGLAVFLAILCRVYREGYYLAAPPDAIYRMVAKDVGSKWVKNPGFVRQVCHECSVLGLFDPVLLEQDVYTSVGIQKRYAKATVRNKAKVNKYCLLASVEENGNEEAWESAPVFGVSATETPISATETEVSATETPIKEKKRKINRNIYIEPPTEAEVIAYCEGKGYAFGRSFYSFYASQGWKTTSGASVNDWKARADAWAQDERNKPKGENTGFDADEAMAKAMERSYKR